VLSGYLRLQEVKLHRSDGSVPVVFALELPREGTIASLKEGLAPLCGLPVEALAVVDTLGSAISRVYANEQRVRVTGGHSLAVYEISPASVAAAEEATAVVGHGPSIVAVAAAVVVDETIAPADGFESIETSADPELAIDLNVDTGSTSNLDLSAPDVASPPAAAATEMIMHPALAGTDVPPVARPSPQPSTATTARAQAPADARWVPGHLSVMHRRLEATTSHFLTRPLRAFVCCVLRFAHTHH
jgi:hypothetical protein